VDGYNARIEPVYTKRILRWVIVFMFSTTILVWGAILLGERNPTTVLITSASLWMNNNEQTQLLITDLNHNLSHRISFPIKYAILHKNSFNTKSHHIFLELRQRDYTFAIWDLEENRVIYPPLGYDKCDFVVFQDWLNDDTGVIKCHSRDQLNPEIEGFYLFNAKTGSLYHFYQFKERIPFLIFSPTNDRLLMLDDDVLYNITAQGDKNKIDTPIQGIKNVSWFPNGQSFLIIAPPLMAVYSFIDQSTQIIFSNATVSNHTNALYISPNGEWVTWIDNAWSFHILHIPTGVDRILQHPDIDLDYDGRVVWSPDSQYLIVQLSNSGLYYLIKPDNSFTKQLIGEGNHFTNSVIWSPDSQYLLHGYEERSTDYLSVISLARFLADEVSPDWIMTNFSPAAWLPNGGFVLAYYPTWSITQTGYYYPTTGIRLLTNKQHENVGYIVTILGYKD